MAAAKEHKKKKTKKKTLKESKKQQRKDGSSHSEPLSTDALRKRNPKAFVFSSRGKAKVQKARSAEKEQRRMHGESCQLAIYLHSAVVPLLQSVPLMLRVYAVPMVEKDSDEPPPFLVLVHGPPGVGKTTLVKNLVKHYTRQNLGEVKGPVTLVSGKNRRLTFVECPQVVYLQLEANFCVACFAVCVSSYL